MVSFNGVKVFSATKHIDRANLGKSINMWLAENRVEIVNTVVTQSSDSEFHCLTITLFYRRAA